MQRTQNYNLVKIDLTDSPPDITVLNENFDTIDTTLLNKVDKAEGKQLSTNDYTTEEKSKPSGIADNANNYIHPESHPATIITEDETHRFLTDVERNKLNGIAESANNYVHPPTHTASEITEEENKKFLTDAERTKLSGIQDGANNYTHPESHPASMIIIGDARTLQEFFNNGGTINGMVTINSALDVPHQVGTNKIKGFSDGDKINVGNGTCRLNTEGGIFRIFTSALETGVDNGLLIGGDGSLSVKCNNVNTHVFHANGSKTAGVMEIDGTVYGMSPTDSPQTIIEYLEYEINVNGEKVINLDPIYKKMISKYVVFSSNSDIKIVEKTSDYFKVKGNGVVDFAIKGQRKDAEEYFRIMGGLDHGVTEEQSN